MEEKVCVDVIKFYQVKVIEDIHKAMKHIDDDELVELSVRVAEKLEKLSDEEYVQLDLYMAEQKKTIQTH